MRTRTSYTAEQKSKVHELIAAGKGNEEIFNLTGVKPNTVSNWRKEVNGAGENGDSAPKKRRRKRVASVEDPATTIQSLEFTVSLRDLENESLRKMLQQEDEPKRMVVEIHYLRNRLKLWGDEQVQPLGSVPMEEETTETDEA